MCGFGGSVVSSVNCVRRATDSNPTKLPRRDLGQLPVAPRRVNSETGSILYSGAPLSELEEAL